MENCSKMWNCENHQLSLGFKEQINTWSFMYLYLIWIPVFSPMFGSACMWKLTFLIIWLACKYHIFIILSVPLLVCGGDDQKIHLLVEQETKVNICRFRSQLCKISNYIYMFDKHISCINCWVIIIISALIRSK